MCTLNSSEQWGTWKKFTKGKKSAYAMKGSCKMFDQLQYVNNPFKIHFVMLK